MKNEMTYQEFKIEYSRIFNIMMCYSPEEVGSEICAEKMATLADDYPEFTEKFEDELEISAYN